MPKTSTLDCSALLREIGSREQYEALDFSVYDAGLLQLSSPTEDPNGGGRNCAEIQRKPHGVKGILLSP